MKIAIIGSGISGLGAAYLLHQDHEITVYEKNDYVGGHSRTLEVETPEGRMPVDTGFIVFNYRNYPLLTALFDHAQVPVEKSDMSFGVSIDGAWLEYATQDLGHLFAQKRNLFRPAFLKMLRNIFAFNKGALKYLSDDREPSLGEVLDELRMGDYFRRYYILAMGGAIWSCPIDQMLDFPAKTFIRFFHNHGLLTVNDQPQWYTVTGGSREYVKRVSEPFKDRIHLGCGAENIKRTEAGVSVTDEHGNTALYDEVILACHSDQALALLDDASEDEKTVLGDMAYQPNEVVLHYDESFMPKAKKAWASWVYLSESREDKNPHVSLTYWMNNLQNLKTKTPILITLNPTRQPAEDKVFNRHVFEHPVFDGGAIAAQEKIESIQGKQHTWYCGAYQRYGFHEDGLMSGVAVAKALGANVPWS